MDELDSAYQKAAPHKEPAYEPSHYQKDIFQWVEKGKGNAVVEAVAGSGKTTVILDALKLMKGKVLFCAFNKHIAEELSLRAPRHAQVSTIHSLGFRAIRKTLGNVQVDGTKVRSITEEIVGNDPFDQEQILIRRALRQLTSLTKLTLTDYNDPKQLEDLLYRYDIETNGETEVVLDLMPVIMERNLQLMSTVIDFDDMVWFPNEVGLNPQAFDWICIDESQDLNAAQRELVLKVARKNGRVLAVGDHRQACYGFAGADTESISVLTKRLKAKTLPLSICYRCPTSHIKLAKEIVPGIEAAEGAAKGTTGDLSFEKALEGMQYGDLVLCRMNSPLAEVAMSLIRSGKKAVIRGRDISSGLVGIIRRMKAKELPQLLEKLENYRIREMEKLVKARKESKAEALADKIETIIALSDGIKTIRGLQSRIESIFTDKKEGVVCSSVHRAKGLEAERCFVYRPELMPLAYATEPWQIEQEENLRYVSLTRAKKELWFVSKKE